MRRDIQLNEKGQEDHHPTQAVFKLKVKNNGGPRPQIDATIFKSQTFRDQVQNFWSQAPMMPSSFTTEERHQAFTKASQKIIAPFKGVTYSTPRQPWITTSTWMFFQAHLARRGIFFEDLRQHAKLRKSWWLHVWQEAARAKKQKRTKTGGEDTDDTDGKHEEEESLEEEQKKTGSIGGRLARGRFERVARRMRAAPRQ